VRYDPERPGRYTHLCDRTGSCKRYGAKISYFVDGRTAASVTTPRADAEDLVQSRVIGYARVIRTALQNAAFIAGLLLTTESVVVECPENAPACRAAAWATCNETDPVL